MASNLSRAPLLNILNSRIRYDNKLDWDRLEFKKQIQYQDPIIKEKVNSNKIGTYLRPPPTSCSYPL